MKLSTKQIKRLLLLIADYSESGEIFWNSNLEFFANCSDVFFWATSDAVEIETKDDVDLLEECFIQAQADGLHLYCAKKQRRRPQGAYYNRFDRRNWHLFDECGPFREIGFGNPIGRS